MADNNPLVQLLSALVQPEAKTKEVLEGLEKQALEIQNGVPSENASNAEVIEYFITMTRKSVEEREKQLNIEKAELALWRVKFAARPDPAPEDKLANKSKDDSYALLDAKEKLLEMQFQEAAVARRFIDILHTVYN